MIEKTASLKAAEVPEKFSIFKMHLSFMEKGWLKTNDNLLTETYRSLTGHVFSIIREKFSGKEICCADFLIDDEASLEEIDVFLDAVLSDDDVANLAWFFQIDLQSKYFCHVLGSVTKRIGSNYAEDHKKFDHFMFIAPASKPTKLILPTGYKINSLVEDHVETITSQWALDNGQTNREDLVIMVMDNITKRPCFGIFTESDFETPIAWICIYSDGEVGMLHVKERHRGKGLARVLLRQSLKVVQETHGMECRAHANVEKNNTASKNLLLSEGWELQPYNYKKIFFRNLGSTVH
jgi:GNAT superfamily N-acetyltransferase